MTNKQALETDLKCAQRWERKDWSYRQVSLWFVGCLYFLKQDCGSCNLGFAELENCMCKRGFGSPRIWIPHPKTLADLDDPNDPRVWFPPFTLYAIASRMMTSNFGSQIREHQGPGHTDKRIRFCDKILRKVLRYSFAESLSRDHTAIVHRRSITERKRIHCSFSSFCTATWCMSRVN